MKSEQKDDMLTTEEKIIEGEERQMTIVNRRAYTEVLEILKHISQEELNKIPTEIIKFMEDNRDNTYNFTYDVSQSLGEQKVLRETNSIIIYIFKKYFATDVQKEKINNILMQNELIYQKKLKEKYNPELLFKKKEYKIEDEKESIENNMEEVSLIEYKENIFIKLIKKIKNNFLKIFH